MNARKSLKLVLLAATAGVALGFHASTGHAAPAVSAPTYVAPTPPPVTATAEVAPDDARTIAPKAVGIAALFAGALALGVRLIGKKRLDAAAAAVKPHVARVTKAAGAAMSAAGAAVTKPMRAAFLGLGLFLMALTCADMFNVEWAFGLAAGAVLTLFAIAGAPGEKVESPVFREPARPMKS